MKKNKTEIVILMDRSGSMSKISKDMEGAISHYIKGQQELKGECFVTLYQFNTITNRIFENVNVNNVGEIYLNPSGGTALFDAVGTAIDEVGIRLAQTSKNERPELVIFVVVTDGEENSSHKFSKKQVGSKISHQEDKYNWQFLFLGANFDAFEEGQNYGFKGGKSMTYVANTESVNNTWDILSETTAKMRSCVDKAQLADYAFSTEDRKKAQGN